MISMPPIDVRIGQSAHDLLGDAAFLAGWKSLHRQCPHATGYQSPGFVGAWYESYKSIYRPVIAISRSANGDLLALWLLAFDPATKELVHAGSHQAEYHLWLALPEAATAFLTSALLELRRHIQFTVLRFKYLPSAALVDTLQAMPGMKNRIAVKIHRRPLLNIDPVRIKESLAKKKTKSRFNRLKKLGVVEFRRVTELGEFDRIIEDFVAFYDFRQSAVNHTMPFREDPLKRPFHRALLAAAPSDIHLTVTYLDGRLIAALWATISGKTLHIGIPVHSPLLAEHSPGKLHIMQLSEFMTSDAMDVLDLTPGKDPWKEGFANAHDEVAEALIYRSAVARGLADAKDWLRAVIKRCVAAAGVEPQAVRKTVVAVQRARASVLVRRARQWIGALHELRIYRGNREFSGRFTCDERVATNAIADLLLIEARSSWDRDAFLAEALERLKRGESVYTICVDGRLAHYGWMVRNQTEPFFSEVQQSITLPPGSVSLYDFYTHPAFRGRGLYRATMSHMLQAAFVDEATQYAYVSVLADNPASRHVIEGLGFRYQRSLHWQRRFGREKSWADAVVATTESSDASK
jgi:CelD/BcsL family acetyltransferase involved in cellulose biosynthesis/RimJ/RimL family protein N-acetyltransferase